MAMVRGKKFVVFSLSIVLLRSTVQADCAAFTSQIGKLIRSDEGDDARGFATPYLNAMPELSELLKQPDLSRVFWQEVSRVYEIGGENLLLDFLDAADVAASNFQIGSTGIYLPTIKIIRDAALGLPTSKAENAPDLNNLSYYILNWEELRPNILYEANIQQPLYNQTTIRVQFAERALQDLTVEAQHAHDRLLPSILRGHAHNGGTGIKHLTNYIIYDRNGTKLSVYEIKPAGDSSFRWVAVRRQDGSLYILKRSHKDEMQRSSEIVNFEF